MAHAYHPSASEGKAGDQELKVILSHITGSRTACTTWVSPLTVTTTVTENKNYNVSSSVCLAFLTIYNIQKHVYMLQGLKASKESLRVNSGFKPLEEKPTLRDFIDFIEEVWKNNKTFRSKVAEKHPLLPVSSHHTLAHLASLIDTHSSAPMSSQQLPSPGPCRQAWFWPGSHWTGWTVT